MIDQRVVKGVCLKNSVAKLNLQYASFSNRLKEQGPKIIFKYLVVNRRPRSIMRRYRTL